MADKARVQYKSNADPEAWQDVDETHPLPVTSDDVVISDAPPISFEGGGGAETTVSDVNPLPVDCTEVEDVDDDAIAKSQVLPLKLNLPYVFDKSGDKWIRTQGSTDGYPFVRPIGVFDTAGHQLDIEATTGALYSNLKGFRSSDSSYQPLRLDKATNTLQTISYEHHEVHSGSHFFVSGVQDLSINNVLDFTWQMPNTTTWTHWTWHIDTESETLWQVYEGATATNPLANAVTPLNSNRNSATASGTTMKFELQANLAAANTDTDVSAATLIMSGISGAGRSGGEADRSNETVLKQNTLYVLRATATAAGFVNFNMQWYEHADIA